MLKIINDFIAIGTKRRSGIKNNGIKFLVAHDTGNPNSTARQNVNYFKNSANEMSASAQIFVDDIEVICCIPEDEKAWHVLYGVTTDNNKYGCDANDNAIGVELSYFPNDKERTKRAYDKYVEVFAYLCEKYQLSPLKFISGHFELDPARKTDPMNAFKIIGKNMSSFFEDIKNKMNPVVPIIKPCKLGDQGDHVALIKNILKSKGYWIGIDQSITDSLYSIAMAQSVLYFQLQNKVADNEELAQLRGESVGPRTVASLTKLL